MERYRGPGFFARGNGGFSIDDAGIHFRKLMTEDPLTIGWDETADATLGKWHAGRWAMGRPILKISFDKDGLDLIAGFYLSNDWTEMQRLAADMTARISR